MPAPSDRRLAAVVFTDIVGYSELVHRDEALGAKLLDRQRAVVRRLVPEHGGREVETAGDSFLLEFGSALAAVQAVLEIQKALAAENAADPSGKVVLRASVHLGDVEHRGKEVYGDGVNIAARLLPHSPEGGLSLSAPVLSLIRQRLNLPVRSIGSPPLKNIANPVEIFVVDAKSLDGSGSLKAPAASTAKAEAAEHVAICVLPFANISGDPEQEYFSDGITEDIITDLSKVSALSVVSRNTSFTYKGKPADIGQVARQLKVSHVLEGSVRKAGNRVRITAQLIRAADDSHLWAERYDRDLNDIFALQDEISAAIVHALKLKLMPSEKKAIESRSTTNAEAYKVYLMARQFHLRAGAARQDIVVRLCRRAVEIDPNYARAWALLATSLSNWVLQGRRDLEEGWHAAERAVTLDPNLAEAHSAKARQLVDAGRYDDAGREHEIALGLDPDSYDVNAAAGRYYMAVKRNTDAIRVLRRAAEQVPTDCWAIGMAIACHEAIGDREGMLDASRQTLERVEKIIAIESDNGPALGFGQAALARLGQKERAIEWAERALLLDPDNVNLRYNTSCSLVNMGEHPRAFELLESVLKVMGRAGFEWFKSDSDFTPVRDHPRIKELTALTEARLLAEEAAAKPAAA